MRASEFRIQPELSSVSLPRETLNQAVLGEAFAFQVDRLFAFGLDGAVSKDDNEEPESTPPPNPPAPSFAEEKARLECKKLEAEIEAIRKPPHRTTAFYGAVSPVLLAALGLLWSWGSGWFDVQRTRVSNEKTMVEAQTERLKTEKLKLDQEATEQHARVAAIELEVAKLKEERSLLTNQIGRLEHDRNEMRLAKEFFESEAKRLAGSETNALRLFGELQAAQASREQLADKLQSLQATNRMLWVSVSNQTALLRQAQDVMRKGARIALYDKAIFGKFMNYFEDVNRFDVSVMEYFPEWQTDEDRGLPPGVRRNLMKTYEDYINEARARATNEPHLNVKPKPGQQ